MTTVKVGNWVYYMAIAAAIITAVLLVLIDRWVVNQAQKIKIEQVHW